MFSRRARLALSIVAASHCCLLLSLSWLRFSNVHQRTFDLALYARIAWGLAHGDLWASVINTNALGCHLSPVLLPLGLLGRVFGTVPVLLFAQSLSLSLSVFPIARIGARRLGTRGIWLAVVAFLLYPNLVHVGSYEFHPGTLAVLPMVWAFDALDRAHLKHLSYCMLAVLACREDLGVFCVVLALVFYAKQRDKRSLYVAAGAGVYTVAALAVVAAYAPVAGSLAAHFGHWGGSPLGVLSVLVQDPARVVAHLREHAMYLPQVLAPLSFFSLRAPLQLLPGIPYLLLNLLSAFPTADEQYSHYLTPAVPALIVSGIVGVTEVRKRFLQLLWFVTLGIAHHALGGSPLSRDFEWRAFSRDAATDAAEGVLARIPAHDSVQAPDALLPHLAERRDVRRAAAPESGARFTVLDVSHRLRFARSETLLRTSEEPFVRSFLARRDQTLVVYAPPYALFVRGRGERLAGAAAECAEAARPAPTLPATTRLTGCLVSGSAELTHDKLTLVLHAEAACPADLALRFGPDPMPARVEQLCGGTLSPASLKRGDTLRFDYRVSEHEARELRQRGLWVGTLQASGAPVEPGDSAALPVQLHVEAHGVAREPKAEGT